MGRPSTYTHEIAEEICCSIATSPKGLKELCKENPHWPTKKCIMEWRLKNKDFSDQYARAKAAQIESLIDEMLSIANDGTYDFVQKDDGKIAIDHEHIQRSKLRIDTIKWLACKLAPKIYGDKMQHDTSITLSHEEMLRKLI